MTWQRRREVAASATAELAAAGLPARPVEAGELIAAIDGARLPQRQGYSPSEVDRITDRIIFVRRRTAPRFDLTEDGRLSVAIPGRSADNLASVLAELRIMARDLEDRATVAAAEADHARGLSWERCAVRLGISRRHLERMRAAGCDQKSLILSPCGAPIRPHARDAA